MLNASKPLDENAIVHGQQNYWFRHIVLQPTTFCNISCSYCYLPGRSTSRRMSPQVTKAIARLLERRSIPVRCLWHGGEPLSIGEGNLRELISWLEPSRRRGVLSHSIQTNGTLINKQWCSFFKEYGFQVGVSLDGAGRLNGARLLRSGENSYERAAEGISWLRNEGVEFSILCVVSKHNIASAQEIYETLAGLGAQRICFNIEEREGANRNGPPLSFDEVRTFWSELFAAWRHNPKVPIREFDKIIGWMESIVRETPRGSGPRNMWPTIGWNGDIFLMSPEFMAVSSDEVERFVAGNVLVDNLDEVIARAGRLTFVREFEESREACRTQCAYFDYCRGGHASNKFFEANTMRVTETDYCRNAKIALVDAVVEALRSER